ncbi:MAG: regulatory protein RecX [Nocardioidaceae bacterium]
MARGARSSPARSAGRSGESSNAVDALPLDGREVDPDPDEGPDADPGTVARRIALRRLTDQPRTRADLAQALAKRNVPDDVAVPLLDRFEEVGLLDDAAYARAWVSSRQAGRGLARRALAVELRRKGVPDDVANAALDELDPDAETETARRLVRRKLTSTAGLDPAVRRRRLVGLLARRGYPAGVAARVVGEELAALADDCDVDRQDDRSAR